IASRARPDRTAVMIADVATGETREVGTALSTPWGPAWSPDGKTLAFADQDAVWLVDRDGSRLRPIAQATALNGPWIDQGTPHLTWLSADDIRFDVARSGERTLYRLHADGAPPTPLATPCADASFPVWSPGGRFYGCSAHTRFSGDP